jgi:hypothetical protein
MLGLMTWEKFSRATSRPAATSSGRTLPVLAGPMVQTILVRLLADNTGMILQIDPG